MSDRVKAYLRERGCSEPICAGGLSGLVREWERFARDVAEGYRFGIEDYRNDADLRDVLEGALKAAGEKGTGAWSARVLQADNLFKEATEPCRSIYPNLERSEIHDKDPRWWYFRKPRRPGPELQADLRAAGL